MSDKPLPRSTVLHIILRDFEPQLKKVVLSQHKFAELLIKLAGDDEGLSDSAISRWLAADKPIRDARVTSILDIEQHANAVADACGIPRTIFNAATLSDVKAIVASHLSRDGGQALSSGGSWVVNSQRLPPDLPMVCGSEEKIIARLLSETSKARKHVIKTSAPFDAGISFLWYLTAVRNLVPQHAEAVYLLRPEIKIGKELRDVIQNFEGAISWLATTLGLSQKVDGPTLVEKLIATRSMVIFHTVSGSFDGRAEAVVRSAFGATKGKDQPPAVIISAALHEKRFPMKLPLKELTIDEGDVNVDLNERYPFFRALWQRYCFLRRTYRPDEGGSRLKRARWHYSFLGGERQVYPINIRLRAFFASDLTNFSYFDPTAGFERLCNMSDQPLPAEIAMFRDDVRAWVVLWDAPKKNPPLRPLKWCSTAIYWLTQEAAEDLGTKFQFADVPDFKEREIVLRPKLPLKPQPVPEVDPDTFRDAAQSLPAIIWYEPDRDNNPEAIHYVAGIGIKAIVQDHWLRKDPAARSYAHFRIAKRLYEKQHRKEALSEEFPFTPHWGRSGIFFLAECIRHLMRAIAPIEKAAAPKNMPKRDEKFVAPPSRSMLGCDPHEVLSFCFGQIYWKEIDGNSSEIDARKLSQRHGLYHLSAELLQLMSNNERLGEPHWALDRSLHGKYYSAAAFAQFELGELKSAQELFRKRLAYVQEAESGSLAELTAELDLIAVKIELQQFDELLDEIAQVEARLQAGLADDRHEAAKQVRLHCSLLKGQICYSNGEFDAAQRLLKEPHDEIEDDRLSIEASHYLVASKGAKAEQLGGRKDARTAEENEDIAKLRDEALMIASRRLWHYSSEGEQHVTLGFRISSAHLFRNMGKNELAETWMNSVYIDILRYGCSERTYLSFLREAGRIVRESKRPARAYAVYLKPAAIRAASRGHVRAARVAFDEAMGSLSEVEAAIDHHGKKWEATLAAELQEPKELSEEADTDIHDFVPADPLFSFDLLGRDEWSVRLLSKAALEAERAAFVEEFGKLQRGAKR